MSVYHSDDLVTLHHGDCLDVLRSLPDASVDAVVCDPPYGLGFMGREWDSIKAESSRPASADATDARFKNAYPRTGKGPAAVAFDGIAFQQWCQLWTAECLRVLKPGGHLLAFGGTRTWHRLACAVEDAGFEVRDSIAWLYGSGFPKSLDVSKAIDKAAGAEREVVGAGRWAAVRGTSRAASQGASNGGEQGGYNMKAAPDETAPATPDAERWQGWGTALKPAFEPIVVARKPLAGTVAANVLEHGTGALNIDACRVGETVETWPKSRARPLNSRDMHHNYVNGGSETVATGDAPAGRWPTNVVLDGHQADELDEQSGDSTSRVGKPRGADNGPGWGMTATGTEYDDTGGASRFFPVFRYEAKAPTSERPKVNGTAHPTVKPLDLMRWLVRLVTPPGGTVLEPFAGSGTTVEACVIEGFRCIAIEKTDEYLPLTVARIHRQRNPVEAIRQAGDDLGLFEGLEGMGA